MLVFFFLIHSNHLFLFRNLYALVYKTTHPDVTEVEFRRIYKGLDKETVKVGTCYFLRVGNLYTKLIGFPYAEI